MRAAALPQRSDATLAPEAQVLSEEVVVGKDVSASLRAMDRALHDLSQPLTSIALALEILARERDPETVESMLTAARRECARAMRDVKTLRVQTNRMLDRASEAGRGGQ